MIAPKGTKDVLPSEIGNWRFVEDKIRDLCSRFGYAEMRTPVFEYTEVFERGVGDTTDVVQKEMYTFLDKGGRSITLRPEGTAPFVRSFIENHLYAGPQPTKLFYITSCYRYEKPQAGRLREFHQFGIETFGAAGPAIDAEVISLASELFRELGVKGLQLYINSIGCPECRAKYNDALRNYFEQRKGELCSACLERLDKNPLRILDCKSPDCQKIAEGAPVILDYLCGECEEHFTALQDYLSAMGIEFKINPNIVRGLDYYTKTVFEFVSDSIGAQGTVCGGGRYDGLVEELGGSPTPGMGFGLGLERLLLLLESQGITLPQADGLQLFLATIGENAERKAQQLLLELRRAGIAAEKDYMNRSLKAQMKYADKLKAAYTMVLGDDEINKMQANLKNMQTGEQTPVELESLAAYLSKEGKGR